MLNDHRQNVLPELTVTGTPYEIGYQHGSVFRHQINAFLNDHLARINLLRSPILAKDEALGIAAKYAAWIEIDTPEIAEEIRGLAEGADIRYEEAVLMQIRRELIRHDSDSGDCTSVGLVREDGSITLAQTIDLAGNVGEFACLLTISPTNPAEPQICMFTFMGLCGYLGINSSGLAIGLNMVFTDACRPGVPPYLLIRNLLRKASIEEVLAEIKRVRRASSRYLSISDSRSMIGVEMTLEDFRVIDTSPLVHTNHYLHRDFQKLDNLKEPALSHSKERLKRMLHLVNEKSSLELMLRDHAGYPRSICAHSMGSETMTDTVGAVIMVPGEGEMHTLLGHPCEKTFSSHQLSELSQDVGNVA